MKIVPVGSAHVPLWLETGVRPDHAVPPGVVGLEQAYIKGLVKMDDKIMILLNTECIMSQDEHALLAESATATA